MTHDNPASASVALDGILDIRLPAWLLPRSWPMTRGRPENADVFIDEAGHIRAVEPHIYRDAPSSPNLLHAQGAPGLPSFVDAHTHLDSAFTRDRIEVLAPGLLGGIAGKAADRQRWTYADVSERASRALRWASEAGTTLLRTHVDWVDGPSNSPSWRALEDLGNKWSNQVALERVCLASPDMHATRADANALARRVAASGPSACLGSFIHTSNWDPGAIRHLFAAASEHGLDIDFHVDEEMDEKANGLAFIAALVREMRFEGHVVCGHNCALAVQDEVHALSTLDAVANTGITMVVLPQNNLFLQDAQTGRTPRKRGITLVKEARARGIPVLIATDSVQDPFFAMGTFDPVDAFTAAVIAAQLESPFDVDSEMLCRAEWLHRERAPLTFGPGSACDVTVFNDALSESWPSRAHRRTIVRNGAVVDFPRLPAVGMPQHG